MTPSTFILVHRIQLTEVTPHNSRGFRLVDHWLNVDDISIVDENFDLQWSGDPSKPAPAEKTITVGQIILRSGQANMPGHRLYVEELDDELTEMLKRCAHLIWFDDDGNIAESIP